METNSVCKTERMALLVRAGFDLTRGNTEKEVKIKSLVLCKI